MRKYNNSKKILSKERKERIRELYNFYKNLPKPHTEEFVEILLKEIGFEKDKDFIKNFRCKENKNREIDFAFINRLRGIEVQGDYWHNLLNTIERDEEKRILLEKNKWNILYVWEYEIHQALREMSSKKKKDWFKIDAMKFYELRDTILFKKIEKFLIGVP